MGVTLLVKNFRTKMFDGILDRQSWNLHFLCCSKEKLHSFDKESFFLKSITLTACVSRSEIDIFSYLEKYK